MCPPTAVKEPRRAPPAGLAMRGDEAVTGKVALEYRRGNKADKGELVNQVSNLNRGYRGHAGKAIEAISGKTVMNGVASLVGAAGDPCDGLLAACNPKPRTQAAPVGKVEDERRPGPLPAHSKPATIDLRQAKTPTGWEVYLVTCDGVRHNTTFPSAYGVKT